GGRRRGGGGSAGARLPRGALSGPARRGGTVMTTATDSPVRRLPPPAGGAVALTAARLLWLELRRNTMPWLLPLIAALLWFDSYRPSTGVAPYWVLRTFWNMGQGHTIVDGAPFLARLATP